MKKISLLAIAAILVVGIASCDSKKSVSLKSEIDSVSYLIGSSYGHGLKENVKTFPGDPVNLDALISGFQHGAGSDDSLFLGKNDQELSTYLNAFFEKAQLKQAEDTKVESEKWLAENKGKSGVITTESGVQYKVITEGKGAKPTAEDTVVVHYTGKSLDGTVFDSSVQRGEPATFPVGVVIPGWSEAVQLMPLGSKYQIWIPAHLGYGEQGNPQAGIKGNSVIEFEVELLEIKKAK
ncbi:MAG: FKBP-type peptidyl-prolyl cis-trans isomerase [Tannerella sp.]|nr:FKBP-type peptidyl-prolyl cis-trans isomerase [Tannerella sp.]